MFCSVFLPCCWGIRMLHMHLQGRLHAGMLACISSLLLGCQIADMLPREGEMQSNIGVPACVSLGEKMGDVIEVMVPQLLCTKYHEYLEMGTCYPVRHLGWKSEESVTAREWSGLLETV